MISVLPSIDDIKTTVVPVLRQYGIARAGLFGSFADGTMDESSDIDILIETPNEMDLFEFIDLKDELSKVLDRNVDLVQYEGLRKRIKNQILNQEIRFYG